MKKGVVVVLVLLAVIVLVSPAIVGRLAEQSVDENLNWAASESGEVSITSGFYERGWFASEGQHRVELRDGQLKTLVQSAAGPLPDEGLPVLVINTRLDHGLIPVSSMSRDGGSLSPGLGSAVSTLQLEMAGGETIDLPGTIYSKVGLTGELVSNYVLEADSRGIDDASVNWGDADITVITNPSSGVVSFDGTIDEISAGGGDGGMRLSGLSMKGEQRPTEYGIAVGDVVVTLDDVAVDAGMGQSMRISALSLVGTSELDGDAVNASGTVQLSASNPTFPEDIGVVIELELLGADAAALGALQKTLKSSGSSTDPMADFAAMEGDLKNLLAKGFTLNVPKYDVTLPQGTVATTMSFEFAEEDPATFEFTTLLLSTKASIDLSVPAELVESFAQGNPQAAMVVGGGYLVKRGDVYITEARMEKGLLTVNGAPIPIPLGQF